MKIFFILAFVLAGLFVQACSMFSKAPAVTVTVQGTQDKVTGAYLYNGGLFKVYIKLKAGVTDMNSIRWKTGKADIAIRDTLMSGANIVGDTVYLHWESLPKPTMQIDTTTKTVAASSASTSKSSSSTSTTATTVSVYDTTYHYLDTIGVVINGK